MARKKRKIVVFGGQEIPELYVEKLRGKLIYYFKNDKGNKVRRGDITDAIEELNKYRRSKKEPTIPLIYEEVKDPHNLSEDDKRQIELYEEKTGAKIVTKPLTVYKNLKIKGDEPIFADELYDIPKDWLLSQFRKMLEENPKLLSQELGIEELSYLPKLKPKKRYTLKKIGDYYFEREKYTPKAPLSEKMVRESKLYWSEFRKITGVRQVDDLDKTVINKYNAELTKVADNKKYRPNWLSSWQKKSMKGKKLTVKWIKVRLDTVKTILKNSLKVIDYSDDVEAVLKLCRNNFYNEPIPKTIVKYIFEKKHIKAIFEVLDNPQNEKQKLSYIRWKAIILMALNGAFTPVDFTDLTFDDISLKKKQLAMIRKKKNTERYAVLWDRTVDAINEYKKIRPEPNEGYEKYVFISKYGEVLKADNLGGDFSSFVKKVNKLKSDIIPPGLTFKFFRKSSASSAERTNGANPSEVEYLMGHSAGIRNHYTHRATDLVGNVCRKIEKDYFG